GVPQGVCAGVPWGGVAGTWPRAAAGGTCPAVPALADDAIARIAAVRTEVAAAARRAGRDPAAVRIIAVVKTLPPQAVVAALDAGIEGVAENYVQEGIRKRAAGGRRATRHLIGGLQRNKVRSGLEAFDWVHTVDWGRLALALSNAAADAGRLLPVLVQVNPGGTPGQRGVAPDGAEDLARGLVGHPALALQGLMTIAPAGAPADVL